MAIEQRANVESVFIGEGNIVWEWFLLGVVVQCYLMRLGKGQEMGVPDLD